MPLPPALLRYSVDREPANSIRILRTLSKTSSKTFGVSQNASTVLTLAKIRTGSMTVKSRNGASFEQVPAVNSTPRAICYPLDCITRRPTICTARIPTPGHSAAGSTTTSSTTLPRSFAKRGKHLGLRSCRRTLIVLGLILIERVPSWRWIPRRRLCPWRGWLGSGLTTSRTICSGWASLSTLASILLRGCVCMISHSRGRGSFMSWGWR